MLFVKTIVLESDIQGLGLFADEPIPKGTILWKFTPGFDMKFSREEILRLPEILQRFLCTYSWKSKKSGLYCMISDNGRYVNHSDQPNVLSKYEEQEEEVVSVALKDISQGEELTENYTFFETNKDEDNILQELGHKYDILVDFC